MTSLKWRTALVLLVTALGVAFLIPTFSGPAAKLPKFLQERRLHLGLDLQGGMHLVLEVEAEKAVENAVARMADDLRARTREQGIRTRALDVRAREIQVLVLDAAAADQVVALATKTYPTLQALRREQTEQGVSVAMGVSAAEAKQIERRAVEQGIETIRNRVDQFGVAEPTIVPQGEREILIQLPGIKDPERAIALIGKTAQLEFRLLDEEMSPEQAMGQGVPAADEILYQHQVDPVTRQVAARTPLLVQKRTLMTGDVVTDARVEINQAQYNEPSVAMEFNTVGAQLFERITGENVGKRLAIVLDGVVQSAPVIRERIAGGRAQISGRFTVEEAGDLAIALRSGSLPAPVKILERRNVGPSLGRDSIRSGLLATAVGGACVLLFMLLYYRGTGVLANLALILNLVLILGILAAFRGTLTLPGIAGIALTVGMAVDANVLINERIREELRLGRSPANAVEGGYEKAFTAILDSNVTTLIAAAVLWQYGTGPVKGFAVTLTIGLLASLFTAVFGTRVAYDWVLRKGVKRLSI
ncbi:MAG: protein translocase subunit SecD [Deltaproteobacteria bacterium]|nr:protein translocase subunit SecD [Deltaproteobacteria bacterium]